MAGDGSHRFEQYMVKAAEYMKDAQWELAENCLHDADKLCTPRFPNAAQNHVRIQLELAEIYRRHGKYQDAINAQEKVVASKEFDEVRKCKVYGELGVNYRHTDKITKAAETFQKHHDLATKLAFEMDAEVCRSVGNLAMVKYQLHLEAIDQSSRHDLLQQSIQMQQERVSTAQALLLRLEDRFESALHRRSMEAIGANKPWRDYWRARLHMWENIGVSRLVLSYIADRQLDLAVSTGLHAVDMSKDASWADPTVRALNRFMYGHALAANNDFDAARIQFGYPQSGKEGKGKPVGICTPAIALCKEPSAEFRGYLQEVIKARVDLTAYDEQGYSALDYAVYSEDTESTKLLKKGLMLQLDEPDDVDAAFKMTVVRKHFREIFHGEFRKILTAERSDCINALRTKYLELLRSDENKRGRFDWLRAVSYRDFIDRGALPRWDMTDEDSVQEIAKIRQAGSIEPFLVFFSYRWIGKSRQPDSAENRQYRRMLDALEQLIDKNPHLEQDNIFIWLVSDIFLSDLSTHVLTIYVPGLCLYRSGQQGSRPKGTRHQCLANDCRPV